MPRKKRILTWLIYFVTCSIFLIVYINTSAKITTRPVSVETEVPAALEIINHKNNIVLQGTNNMAALETTDCKAVFANYNPTINYKPFFQNSSKLVVKSKVVSKVKQATNCNDTLPTPCVEQRGAYKVLYNYIPASRRFRCEESITYTTHADFYYLYYLVPLVERWRGPISLGVYSPGTDFEKTLESIGYLRECSSDLVKKFVTFHLYFEIDHSPDEVPKYGSIFPTPYVCSKPPPFYSISRKEMYRSRNNLLYPINVGRNIAQISAQTHFILAADIDIFPSPSIIPNFLKMFSSSPKLMLRKTPFVFPLHMFKVANQTNIPHDKSALLEMVKNKTAKTFIRYVSDECSPMPMLEEWLEAEKTRGFPVFYESKRHEYSINWAGVFIGTREEPLTDERLSWESGGDRIPSEYIQCVMDYDFLILDNAFLIHLSNVKFWNKKLDVRKVAIKTNELLKNVIFYETVKQYGVRTHCPTEKFFIDYFSFRR